MSCPPRVGTPTIELTPRERVVLGHVALSKTNGQIAVALGIAESSVSMHIVNAREKLDLPSKKHLAEYAREHGFTP